MPNCCYYCGSLVGMCQVGVWKVCKKWHKPVQLLEAIKQKI